VRRPVSVPQIFLFVSALAAPATVVHAQGGAAPAAGRAGGAPNLTAAEPMGPVENLTAYPIPPEGFNVARENIRHGEVKLVEYDSKTLGIDGRCGSTRPLAIRPPAGIPCSICSTGWAIPATRQRADAGAAGRLADVLAPRPVERVPSAHRRQPGARQHMDHGVPFLDWTDTMPRAADGFLALQLHGGVEFVHGKDWVGVDGSQGGATDFTKRYIRYRNVRVKELR
jgi:hypothetical protein